MRILQQKEFERSPARLFLGALILQLLSGFVLCSFAQQQRSSGLEQAIDQAQAAQASDRYAEAAAAYGEATRLDPNVPELWANRGLMEHFAGQPSNAIESFKHALASKPSLYTAVLFTGIDYVALDQPERSLSYLKRAIGMKPENPDGYVALAKAYLALHDLGNAALNYQQAALRRPQDSAAWYGLGVASLGLVDQSGGTLAKRYPKSSWALALYADEMLVQGRTGEASDAYRQAMVSSSASEREIFAAVLKHDRSSSEAAQPSVLSASVDQILAGTQIDQRSYLSSCGVEPARQDPGSHPAELVKRKTACLYLASDAAGSASAAAEQLQINPLDPEALYWSVKTNQTRAVESFVQFERLSPQSAATYDLIGDLYRRRREPDSALEQYAKALFIEPHDPAALLGSAAAYLSIGDMERSLAASKLGLSDSPSNPLLNLLAAESLVNLHRQADAAAYLERCLNSTREKNADSRAIEVAPRAHALMGRVRAMTGDISGAIVEMRLGLPSDQDGSLHFQLSRLYRQQGNLDEAKTMEAESKILSEERRANAVTAVQSPKTSLNLSF